MAILGAPGKTNMEPKNGGLEDDFPFQTCDFSDTVLVFGGVSLLDFWSVPPRTPATRKPMNCFLWMELIISTRFQKRSGKHHPTETLPFLFVDV